MAEGALHFLRGLVIQLPRFKAHALGVVHGGLRLDAEQHLVGVRIPGLKVVAVIGRHKRQARAFGQFQQPGVDALLFGESIGLKLQIKAPGVDARVLVGQGAGLVHVAGEDGAGDLARNAGRKADKAVGIAAQLLLVHAGLVVKPVKKAVADELDEIVIAGIVLGKKDQVVAPLARLRLY